MTISSFIIAYLIVGVLYTVNDVRKPVVAMFFAGFSSVAFFTAFTLGVLTWFPGAVYQWYRKFNKTR